MIKGYFGVPGCGKTTSLVKTALKEQKRLIKRYKNIYTINVQVSGCIPIQFEDLKKYKFENSLILIDEITMDADNREFKSFPREIRDFFILHRHLGVDIYYYTQNFEKVDKIIRVLTQELWYMTKSVVPILKEFTLSTKIYRNIAINEFTSDLVYGYRFSKGLEKIFASNIELVFRRKYYKYFDSYDELSLKDREIYPYTDKIPKPTSKLERFIKYGKRRKSNNNKNNIIKYLNNNN